MKIFEQQLKKELGCRKINKAVTVCGLQVRAKAKLL